jgi:hypothetical protein
MEKKENYKRIFEAQKRRPNIDSAIEFTSYCVVVFELYEVSFYFAFFFKQKE